MIETIIDNEEYMMSEPESPLTETIEEDVELPEKEEPLELEDEDEDDYDDEDESEDVATEDITKDESPDSVDEETTK